LQTIASLLITYRVARGRSWDMTTVNPNTERSFRRPELERELGTVDVISMNDSEVTSEAKTYR
jgi:hypothetical protein